MVGQCGASCAFRCKLAEDTETLEAALDSLARHGGTIALAWRAVVHLHDKLMQVSQKAEASPMRTQGAKLLARVLKRPRVFALCPERTSKIAMRHDTNPMAHVQIGTKSTRWVYAMALRFRNDARTP